MYNLYLNHEVINYMRNKFKKISYPQIKLFLNLYIFIYFIIYGLAVCLDMKGIQRVLVDKFLPIS